MRVNQLAMLVMLLTVLIVPASPATAQTISAEQALGPFQQFIRGLVGWMMGPGRLIIAGAWLLTGFRVVLGMDRGAGPFILVAAVGFAIVFAPQILGALGIDITPYL